MQKSLDNINNNDCYAKLEINDSIVNKIVNSCQQKYDKNIENRLLKVITQNNTQNKTELNDIIQNIIKNNMSVITQQNHILIRNMKIYMMLSIFFALTCMLLIISFILAGKNICYSFGMEECVDIQTSIQYIFNGFFYHILMFIKLHSLLFYQLIILNANRLLCLVSI